MLTFQIFTLYTLSRFTIIAMSQCDRENKVMKILLNNIFKFEYFQNLLFMLLIFCFFVPCVAYYSCNCMHRHIKNILIDLQIFSIISQKQRILALSIYFYFYFYQNLLDLFVCFLFKIVQIHVVINKRMRDFFQGYPVCIVRITTTTNHRFQTACLMLSCDDLIESIFFTDRHGEQTKKATTQCFPFLHPGQGRNLL